MEPKFNVHWSRVACISQTVSVAVRNGNTPCMIQSIVQNGRSSLDIWASRINFGVLLLKVWGCVWSAVRIIFSHGTWHTAHGTQPFFQIIVCVSCRVLSVTDLSWFFNSEVMLEAQVLIHIATIFTVQRCCCCCCCCAVPQLLVTSGTPWAVILVGSLWSRCCNCL